MQADTELSKGCDSYWQLESYDLATVAQLKRMLRTAGCHSLSGLCKSELVKHKQRMDCGLLYYRNCTMAEVQEFARDRHLTMLNTFYRSRWNAIETLTKADKDLIFGRFLDLPAELRNRIYRYYSHAFGETLTTPAQPPLARTCRQIRNESLPVFYRSHSFGIAFQSRYGLVYQPAQDTTAFLLNLSPESVSEIHSLSLTMGHVGSWDGYVVQTEPQFRYSIEIDKTGDKYELRLDWEDTFTMYDGDGTRAGVETNLRRVLDNVCGRNGTKKLKLADVYAMRTAMEKGLEVGGSMA